MRMKRPGNLVERRIQSGRSCNESTHIRRHTGDDQTLIGGSNSVLGMRIPRVEEPRSRGAPVVIPAVATGHDGTQKRVLYGYTGVVTSEVTS